MTDTKSRQVADDRINALVGELEHLSADAIAGIIDRSAPPVRGVIWNSLTEERKVEVAAELDESIRKPFVRSIEELSSFVDSMDLDDVIRILSSAQDAVAGEILSSLASQDRTRVQRILSYPDNVAGSIMDPQAVQIRPDISVRTAMRYLRQFPELPGGTDRIFVVNRANRLLGMVSVARLLTTPLFVLIDEIMSHRTRAVLDMTPLDDVAASARSDRLRSVPVIDQNNMLLGRIRADRLAELFEERVDETFRAIGGASEDTFTPYGLATQHRSTWLLVNLITAVFAGITVKVFDEVIGAHVNLAVLMPIVASMGGIAAMQSLTIMVRANAQGILSPVNTRWLIGRETFVGISTASMFALLIGLGCLAALGHGMLALVAGISIFVEVFVAVISGTTLPLLIKRLGWDPALSGSVIATTVTDVVGFGTLLGLGSLLL